MKRIMLVVAYDGTAYHGWQFQPNEITVEAVLNQALTELLGMDITVIGASRTDAGVHALGNVAVFDTDSRIPPEKFSYALNQRLPEDVKIQKSFQVPDDFHPRKSDCVKTYEYRICNREFPLPTKRRYSYFQYGHFDLEKMRDGARHLVGTHDFTSFCSVNTVVEDKVRTITDIEIVREDTDIVIRVQGTGFLYNMVRIIAGTLIEVGKGMRAPESVKDALAKMDRQAAGPTAPPMGLTLVEIEYPENKLLVKLQEAEEAVQGGEGWLSMDELKTLIKKK